MAAHVKDDRGRFIHRSFVRGDVYNVSSFTENNTGGPGETFTRDLGGVGLDHRYPFIVNTGSISQVIEPVAQIIARGGQANNNLVPITDAQSLIFDDTLLFDINKFSGYDQIETGTRVNYGLQYTLQANNGVTVRTIAGESIQVAGPNAYALRHDPTRVPAWRIPSRDYVLGTYVDYKNMFRGIAQIRFDEKDLSVGSQSYTLQTKLGFLQAGVGYEAMQAQPTLGLATARQEVSGFGALKLTDEWSIFGDLRYDFVYGMFIRNSAGSSTPTNVSRFRLAISRPMLHFRNIKPDTTYLFKLGIKGFGSQTAPSSIYDLSPEAAAYR